MKRRVIEYSDETVLELIFETDLVLYREKNPVFDCHSKEICYTYSEFFCDIKLGDKVLKMQFESNGHEHAILDMDFDLHEKIPISLVYGFSFCPKCSNLRSSFSHYLVHGTYFARVTPIARDDQALFAFLMNHYQEKESLILVPGEAVSPYDKAGDRA